MQLLFLYYNLIINLHEFIFYNIYTTLSLSVYKLSRVLGHFWLSRLKPKKNKKNIKTIKTKNQKNQISNLKKIGFFHP